MATAQTERQEEGDERTLITFDFSKEAAERLDALVSSLPASSRAEVIRRALLLLDHVVTEQDNGYSFLMVSQDGKRKHRIVF